MDTVLEISGLCKEYEGFCLKNVSFTVEKGRIMGFIGRNGAGKTTTLKSLLNLVHPSRGQVRFFGQSFADNELEIKRRIGFVTGGIDYYPRTKIKTITDVTRRLYGHSWDEAAYQKYLDMFALSEKKTPGELSAGMKVKYALSLALSHRAELLILDEPTSGLDPVSRDDLLDVFLSLSDEGVTILFSTHITSDLEKCADDITYIKDGRIVASRPMKDFVNHYRLLELSNEPLSPELEAAIIGLKRSKTGRRGLIEAELANKLSIASQPAGLEDIMVHFEKEKLDEESDI